MESHENITLVTRYVRSLLPEASTLTVERVTEGGSTIVYRIQLPSTTYYLRIWPERGESFAPERIVHDRLHAAGLHVPQVIACEYENALLERSIMLTTAIAGKSVGYGQHPTAVAHIVREAGRELAYVHKIPVQGYGWIKRQPMDEDGLYAEYVTVPEWLEKHFAAPIAALQRNQTFEPHDVQRLHTLLEQATKRFQHEPAVIAHGDFDVTHIFYENESFTGMIDFGEIRGTYPVYDLGHFAIENGPLLPYLLDGYQEVTPLAADSMNNILLTGVLIAARRVGLRLLQGRPFHQPDVAFVRRHVSAIE